MVNNKKIKTAVLTSGGVDSSLALYLLANDKRYEVKAFYIKIWMEDKFSHLGSCPWREDLSYVEDLCEKLGIDLEIVNLQKEYWHRVVESAINEVKRGFTPNSDMWCNSIIKFGLFYDMLGGEYDKVASGHYAKVEERQGGYYLKMSPDKVKDQTYFLSQLSQYQLARALFPIGEFSKDKVRKLAEKYNLSAKHRKDSQGICFLGQVKYDDFIASHLGKKRGDIIDIKSEQKVGEHQGYWFFTIGQRHGLGLPGGPWYVVDKDVKNNIVYAAKGRTALDVAKESFVVRDINWIPQKPTENKLQVKLRHGLTMYNCQIAYLLDNKIRLKIAHKDRGVSPGQFAVFYKSGYCLGGGVIQQTNHK